MYRVVFSAAGAGPDELGLTARGTHPGRASLDALIAEVAACTPEDAAPPGATLPVAPLPGGGEQPAEPATTAVQLWCFLHGLADLRLAKPELNWPPPELLIAQTLAALGLAADHQR